MSAFVQTLACHQYSAKPISKSMLICSQWCPWRHIPIIFTMFNFSFIEDALKVTFDVGSGLRGTMTSLRATLSCNSNKGW